MADRIMKHRLSEAEQFKLKHEHRELYLLVMTMVSAIGSAAGNKGEPLRVNIPAAVFRTFDAFADLGIYKNEQTGDVSICVGAHDMQFPWVKIERLSLNPLDELKTLLFKARPHIENGVNNHATDRYDAQLVLREMDRMGIE